MIFGKYENLLKLIKNFKFRKIYFEESKKSTKDYKIIIGCVCLVLSLLFYRYKIKKLSFQVI